VINKCIKNTYVLEIIRDILQNVESQSKLNKSTMINYYLPENSHIENYHSEGSSLNKEVLEFFDTKQEMESISNGESNRKKEIKGLFELQSPPSEISNKIYSCSETRR
jgi:hypothetical protein